MVEIYLDKISMDKITYYPISKWNPPYLKMFGGPLKPSNLDEDEIPLGPIRQSGGGGQKQTPKPRWLSLLEDVINLPPGEEYLPTYRLGPLKQMAPLRPASKEAAPLRPAGYKLLEAGPSRSK